jgi:hypothetical protein
MEMNATHRAEQQMNTTILNYPGFQILPQGVKQMLLVSEAHFSGQPVSRHQGQKAAAQKMRSNQMKAHPRQRPLTFGDFVAGVYRTWGQRRAKGIIELAIKAHLIEVRGAERFVIS